MSPLVLEHWSDPLCVWAFLAEPKLDRLLAAFPDRVEVRWRVVPLFGSVRARFTDGPWREDGPAGRARKTAELCARHGWPAITGRVWEADTPATSWAAAAAFEAVALLERQGEVAPGTSGEWLRRLRRRFFVDDRNVARRDEQRAVAEELGLPWDRVADALDDGRALAAVFEAHEQRQRQGLQGSPSFVFDGGRAILYGDVHEGVLHATVEQLLAGRAAGASRC
jgi:predicted DsbA family dithiol-disulfide isomerase